MISMSNLVDMVLTEAMDGETVCIDSASPEKVHEQLMRGGDMPFAREEPAEISGEETP